MKFSRRLMILTMAIGFGSGFPWPASAEFFKGFLRSATVKKAEKKTGSPEKYLTIKMGRIYGETDPRNRVHYVSSPGRYEIVLESSTQRWRYRENYPLADGHYFYHMDAAGRIFALRLTDDSPATFQHSSLPAGGPVAGVGLMVFENAHMRSLDRCSGHYMPSVEIFEQVLSELQERRMNFDNVVIGRPCT